MCVTLSKWLCSYLEPEKVSSAVSFEWTAVSDMRLTFSFFSSSWALPTQLTEVHILEKLAIVWTLDGLKKTWFLFPVTSDSQLFLETITLFSGLFLLSLTHKQGVFSLGIQTSFRKSDLLLSLKKDQILSGFRVIWLQWGLSRDKFYLLI